MVPFKEVVVSYRLAILSYKCAISNHSASICHRMSPTLKLTAGGSIWGKIWEGRD